mgnify:CR=1 FL=1
MEAGEAVFNMTSVRRFVVRASYSRLEERMMLFCYKKSRGLFMGDGRRPMGKPAPRKFDPETTYVGSLTYQPGTSVFRLLIAEYMGKDKEYYEYNLLFENGQITSVADSQWKDIFSDAHKPSPIEQTLWEYCGFDFIHNLIYPLMGTIQMALGAFER